jgi:hypothetical protein
MVQARAVIRVADIHAWPASDGIKTLQNGNGRRVIGIRNSGVGFGRRLGVVGHAGGRLQAMMRYYRYIASTGPEGQGEERCSSTRIPQ